MVQPAIDNGFSFCSFDFSAYGRSGGEFATLGLRESEELKSVINHLTENFGICSYYLWGRSMGAATAIHYSSQNFNYVRGMVLDSPFSDVRVMIKDTLAESGVPRFITALCLLPISSTVKDKTGYDVLDNSPAERAAKIQVPTMIMVGEQDTMTRADRVKEIFDAIPGTKRLCSKKGMANVRRHAQQLAR